MAQLCIVTIVRASASIKIFNERPEGFPGPPIGEADRAASPLLLALHTVDVSHAHVRPRALGRHGPLCVVVLRPEVHVGVDHAEVELPHVLHDEGSAAAGVHPAAAVRPRLHKEPDAQRRRHQVRVEVLVEPRVLREADERRRSLRFQADHVEVRRLVHVPAGGRGRQVWVPRREGLWHIGRVDVRVIEGELGGNSIAIVYVEKHWPTNSDQRVRIVG